MTIDAALLKKSEALLSNNLNTSIPFLSLHCEDTLRLPSQQQTGGALALCINETPTVIPVPVPYILQPSLWPGTIPSQLQVLPPNIPFSDLLYNPLTSTSSSTTSFSTLNKDAIFGSKASINNVTSERIFHKPFSNLFKEHSFALKVKNGNDVNLDVNEGNTGQNQDEIKSEKHSVFFSSEKTLKSTSLFNAFSSTDTEKTSTEPINCNATNSNKGCHDIRTNSNSNERKNSKTRNNVLSRSLSSSSLPSLSLSLSLYPSQSPLSTSSSPHPSPAPRTITRDNLDSNSDSDIEDVRDKYVRSKYHDTNKRKEYKSRSKSTKSHVSADFSVVDCVMDDVNCMEKAIINEFEVIHGGNNYVNKTGNNNSDRIEYFANNKSSNNENTMIYEDNNNNIIHSNMNKTNNNNHMNKKDSGNIMDLRTSKNDKFHANTTHQITTNTTNNNDHNNLLYQLDENEFTWNQGLGSALFLDRETLMEKNPIFLTERLRNLGAKSFNFNRESAGYGATLGMRACGSIDDDMVDKETSKLQRMAILRSICSGNSLNISFRSISNINQINFDPHEIDKIKDQISANNDEIKKNQHDSQNGKTLDLSSYLSNPLFNTSSLIDYSDLIMCDHTHTHIDAYTETFFSYLLEKLKNIPENSSLGTFILHSNSDSHPAEASSDNMYTVSPPSTIDDSHSNNVSSLPLPHLPLLPLSLPLPVPVHTQKALPQSHSLPLPFVTTSSPTTPSSHPLLCLFPSYLFTPPTIAWIHMQVQWIVWTFGAYERSHPG